MTKTEVAACRNCGMTLIGLPYYKGGAAYHPETKERCKINFYGGYVCSHNCDIKASTSLEMSMPGGTPFTTLSTQASRNLESNWKEDKEH